MCCQPPLEKVLHKDVTEESIMSHMPDLSTKKQKEVHFKMDKLSMQTISAKGHSLVLHN